MTRRGFRVLRLLRLGIEVLLLLVAVVAGLWLSSLHSGSDPEPGDLSFPSVLRPRYEDF